MKTRFMFIQDSHPLTRARVRLKGGADEWVTDEEGRVEIEAQPGPLQVEVYTDRGWAEHTVKLHDKASLFVVDVAATDFGNRSATNFKLGSDVRQAAQFPSAGLTGTETGRYVFEKVLGRGGMGVVYLARDTLLDRPVAIKMLSEELADNPEAQEVFLTEARNLATLSHRHLVPVHDVTLLEGRAMMVTEFIHGENLESLLSESQRLQPSRVRNIATQLTAAVDYLHRQGLIHRDIKPANVILQSDGQVKLIDFGLARSLDQLQIRGTRIRGTPAYMAPEQILGEELTPATDVYQLGVTFFELLSGQLPFRDGSVGFAHVHKPAPRVSEMVPKLPLAFVDLVYMCMQKSPDERPNDAGHLLRLLEAMDFEASPSEIPRKASQDTGEHERHHSQSGVIATTEGKLVQTLPLPLDGTEPSVNNEFVAQFEAESVGSQRSGQSRIGRTLLVIALALLTLSVGGWAVWDAVIDADSPSGAQETSAASGSAQTKPMLAPEETSGPSNTASLGLAVERALLERNASLRAAKEAVSEHTLLKAEDSAHGVTGAMNRKPVNERAGQEKRVSTRDEQDKPSKPVSPQPNIQRSEPSLVADEKPADLTRNGNARAAEPNSNPLSGEADTNLEPQRTAQEQPSPSPAVLPPADLAGANENPSMKRLPQAQPKSRDNRPQVAKEKERPSPNIGRDTPKRANRGADKESSPAGSDSPGEKTSRSGVGAKTKKRSDKKEKADDEENAPRRIMPRSL